MDELIIIIFSALPLYALWLFISRWYKGFTGEWIVRSTLKSNLSAKDYIIMNDLTLPARSGTTQIDHVVLSRYGIFVIETKNMSGWIFGGAKQRTWTQTIRRRKYKVQNPINQNYKHQKVIQEILGVDQTKIHNVVAFVGSATAKTEMPPNVVWGSSELVNYIKYHRKVVLNDDTLRSLSARLNKSALDDTLRTRRDHIRHVKVQSGALGANRAQCPRCGSAMVERANRESGDRFLGCTKFPKCRGTRRRI